MKPPPPGPVSGLSATQEAKAAAMQASTAFPPAWSTRAPVSAVTGWAAAMGFLAALLCNAWVWRSAIHLCGGRIDRARAVACYGVGSLVNTAMPARIGDAARIALFARAFGGRRRDRYWTTGSVFGAIG